jgi:uncharacterized membrane protein YhaH (DUF805 family)
MLGNLIGGFIAILVGVTLAPEVATQVRAAQYNYYNNVSNPNLTGASSTVTGLITLFFCLGIMSAGVAIAAQGLRAAGMLGM